MPNLANDGMASGFSEEYFSFGQSQAAASQSAVALKRNVNAATGGSLNITGVPMPHAGSITGLTIATSANKTAGVATVTPTINGTAIAAATGLAAVALANAAAKAVKFIDAQIAGTRFQQGDLLGVKLTTDGSYLPTTLDWEVIIYVEFEGLQP